MPYNIIHGDCIHGMQSIQQGSIHTCVTSPPYFGLRDYEGGTAEIGQEDTVQGYVDKMVQVFRGVNRILRKDGTLWLNLGDSYMSAKGCTPPPQTFANGAEDGQPKDFIPANRKDQVGLKEKDLIGIPWRVALALQADGWYLRQDIIWHKPNPMPESVRDRCTKAHEYIFLLSKSKKYYFDSEAMKEPCVCNVRGSNIRFGGNKYGDSTDPKHATKSGNIYEDTGLRNKRSVWQVTTKPYRGAHFATFPKDLIRPCVLSGTSEYGCCSACGSPFVRDVERTRIARNELPTDDIRYRPNTYNGAYAEINGKGDAGYTSTKTLGWRRQCKCMDSRVVPCTVFDPFTGSGTTAIVALENDRNFIGTELNMDYIDLASRRIEAEVNNDLFRKGTL